MKILDLHNLQSEPFVYVGRYAPYTKHGTLLRSPLANPNRVKNDHADDRKNCLALYREWLWARIKEQDSNVVQALRAIHEHSNLACWCCEKEGYAIQDDPEVCHAQIIWKAWLHLND